jgi:2-amino-4-hydroxy-6-hydroxymethyldihydropteridine diphosphokinase
MKTVVILLGGNTGNVPLTFRTCIQEFEDEGYFIINISSIYSSSSWGYESEHLYYNQLMVLHTNNNAHQLLNDALTIENKLGRIRTNSKDYTDRPIDIDIMFYESEIMETENLHIPHPRLHLRKFCLVPLMELIPSFIHPAFNRTIAQLLEVCPDNSIVTKL